jgi:hypothetical protein
LGENRGRYCQKRAHNSADPTNGGEIRQIVLRVATIVISRGDRRVSA